jgi:DNA-binding MarR family transcriptional regulator
MPASSTVAEQAMLSDAAAQLRGSLGLLYRRIRQTRGSGSLSLPESSALSRLDGSGQATAAELARLEQVSPQSIGATLQGLEAKKLIQRAPDPIDGRRIILSLTRAGRGVVHSKRAARTEQLTRALGELTPAERAKLLEALPVLDHLAAEL